MVIINPARLYSHEGKLKLLDPSFKVTFGGAVGLAVAVIILFLFFVVLPLYIVYVDIVSLYGADVAILGGFLYWFFHW